MNPGTLDRKILIQRQANASRGRFGVEETDWELFATRMANKQDLRGSESTGNGREIARGEVRFRMRYVPGIKRTDRIQFDGMAYDIVDIQEIERRKLHDVFCVSHSNLTPEGQDAE